MAKVKQTVLRVTKFHFQVVLIHNPTRHIIPVIVNEGAVESHISC